VTRCSLMYPKIARIEPMTPTPTPAMMKGYVTLGKLVVSVEMVDVPLVVVVTLVLVVIPDVMTVVSGLMVVVEKVIVVIPAGGVNSGIMTISGLPSMRVNPSNNSGHGGLDNGFPPPHFDLSFQNSR